MALAMAEDQGDEVPLVRKLRKEVVLSSFGSSGFRSTR